MFNFISTFSQQVSFSEAELAAKHYFAFKMNNNLEVKVSQTYVKTFNFNPSWYAFTMEDGGFVVVAGHRAAGPILGYSDKGILNFFDPSPEWLFLMDEYESYIDSLYHFDVRINDKSETWNNLLGFNPIFKSHVFPAQDTFLISSSWGQNVPNLISQPFIDCDAYNFFIPNTNNSSCRVCASFKCATGCVATAMGQIFNYWQYANDDDAYFDWWIMPDSLNHVPENSNYIAQRDAISYLIRRCGVNVDMEYCSNGCASSAETRDATTVYSDNGYYGGDYDRRGWYSSANWKSKIITELDKGIPIHYRGESGDGAHSFILDGYGEDQFADLFHFNFGWNGASNGFWNLDDNYPDRQAGIFGIKPLYYYSIINLKNIAITLGQSKVYQVSDRINVAGNGTSFQVTGNGITGGKCRMVASNSIHLMPGFKASEGSSFRARAFEPRLLTMQKNQAIANKVKFTEEEKNQNCTVFPNPALDKITFRINYSGNNYGSIYNSTGQLIKKIKLTDNETIVDIGNLSAGIYSVLIVTSQKTFHHRIIKL
jgi:hypothetical protein